MEGARLKSQRLDGFLRGFAGLAVLTLIIALVPALPASASSVTVARDRNYLALGDSVVFGFTPPEAIPPPDYLDADNFVGYPENVAKALDLAVANASCPGETTGSFIVDTAPSNGCENSPGGYRTSFPLHVKYSGAQLSFAVSYLRAHPMTSMVTVGIGANDVFLCQKATVDNCTGSDFIAVLKQIRQNMTIIYAALRNVAHYTGPLVLVSYYSLNYADPVQVAGAKALNAALKGPTNRFGGMVADGFGLFQRASAAFGGDPCKAGLLVLLPTGSCDVHPSVSGQLVLAAAVEQAIAR
jgi:lysophospholipase L1-like esterase